MKPKFHARKGLKKSKKLKTSPCLLTQEREERRKEQSYKCNTINNEQEQRACNKLKQQSEFLQYQNVDNYGNYYREFLNQNDEQNNSFLFSNSRFQQQPSRIHTENRTKIKDISANKTIKKNNYVNLSDHWDVKKQCLNFQVHQLPHQNKYQKPTKFSNKTYSKMSKINCSTKEQNKIALNLTQYLILDQRQKQRQRINLINSNLSHTFVCPYNYKYKSSNCGFKQKYVNMFSQYLSAKRNEATRLNQNGGSSLADIHVNINQNACMKTEKSKQSALNLAESKTGSAKKQQNNFLCSISQFNHTSKRSKSFNFHGRCQKNMLYEIQI